MTPDKWAEARTDIEKRTKIALGAMAVAPGNQALAKNDCATAESAYVKALSDYPDNAAISYNLGRALKCEAAATPDKAAEFELPRNLFVRTRGGRSIPPWEAPPSRKKITDYANTVYTGYHGSDEGLEQLKQQAKSSPLPPAGFKIMTSTEVSSTRQKEFAEKFPQYALWMGIKGQLADANGQQYFEGQLKDADVSGQGGQRALKGMVLDGRPTCRSRELMVSIPDPSKPGSAAPGEILLKLDAPLTGRPATGEIEWDGVPRAFTKEPFLLTMETDKSKITGLKVDPCGAAPAPVRKKAATKKK